MCASDAGIGLFLEAGVCRAAHKSCAEGVVQCWRGFAESDIIVVLFVVYLNHNLELGVRSLTFHRQNGCISDSTGVCDTSFWRLKRTCHIQDQVCWKQANQIKVFFNIYLPAHPTFSTKKQGNKLLFSRQANLTDCCPFLR